MRAVPRQTRVTPGDYAVNVAGLDRKTTSLRAAELEAKEPARLRGRAEAGLFETEMIGSEIQEDTLTNLVHAASDLQLSMPQRLWAAHQIVERSLLAGPEKCPFSVSNISTLPNLVISMLDLAIESDRLPQIAVKVLWCALQSSCRNMAEHAEYTERTQKDESLRDAYRSSSSRVPQALLHIAHGDIDTIENSERRKAWIVVRKTAAGLAREWKGISELLTTG
eukprot:g3083.t1